MISHNRRSPNIQGILNLVIIPMEVKEATIRQILKEKFGNTFFNMNLKIYFINVQNQYVLTCVSIASQTSSKSCAPISYSVRFKSSIGSLELLLVEFMMLCADRVVSVMIMFMQQKVLSYSSSTACSTIKSTCCDCQNSRG